MLGFTVWVVPPNQRLHLTRAPFGVMALDCLRAVRSCPAAPLLRRGRSRAGETHNR